MPFQIRDNNNKAISLKELDKEAAEFWKVPLDEKWYATPSGAIQDLNWFDFIGFEIHKKSSCYTHGWSNVKCGLVKNTLETFALLPFENWKDKIDKKIAFLKPYFDLIDYWESKGYIPVQIKE
jgi:hypothetical protein